MKKYNDMKTITIYQLAVSEMQPNEVSSHESDLYLKCTPVSENLVSNYEFKQNVQKFRSNIDGSMWFDIPFANDLYWTQNYR